MPFSDPLLYHRTCRHCAEQLREEAQGGAHQVARERRFRAQRQRGPALRLAGREALDEREGRQAVGFQGARGVCCSYGAV